MKKILRSRILMWVSILALLAVTVGGTLALMAAQANTVTNQFTVADVNTELKEDLTSGKEAWVKNHGTSPVYVRARIMVSGVAADKVQVVGSVADATDTGKVYLVMANTTTAEETNKWRKDGSNADDFYYYLGVVRPGDVTSHLLKTVVLGTDLQTDDVLKNFSVTIYHESVLAIGTGTDLTSVQNAFEAAGADDIA